MREGYLQQSHPETYQFIIESIKDYAVFATDTEGIVTTWNPGAERILLYKADEIIGRSSDMLYTPEDIAALVPAIELANALRDGKAINERFHVKKNRSRFWGSGLVYPVFNNQGEHIGFTKVMQNISDEEQAQRNLREEQALVQTLVNTYQEPLIVLNQQMIVINATATFIQYFSLDKENIIGKDFYQIIDGGINMADLRLKLEASLKNHEYHSDLEVAYEHPKEGNRSLVVKLRRLYQPPNLLFSLEFDDLTANRAEIAEKDIFISVASHEVRTPISVIKAYGQILDKELKGAKPVVRRAIDKINQQISYMNSLIIALLDTSKINTGKLVLDQEVFNLCDLVTEIIEGFSLTVSSHVIKVNEETECMVYADRVRTATVITNLLSNAVKYSPDGKEVIVHVEHINHQVKISIQDFGMGIHQSEQNKLFQRFGRTDSVKKNRIPGTGLGLHLAAEIIRLEGGEIGFTSEAGKGAVFYFTLPLC